MFKKIIALALLLSVTVLLLTPLVNYSVVAPELLVVVASLIGVSAFIVGLMVLVE